MIKILIVDDDDLKISNINDVLKDIKADVKTVVEKSLNYGLRRIRSEFFNIILLDMSMPTFSIIDSQNFDSYGGKTFLREMKRKKIDIPVIVVTQYDIFGEGISQKTAEKLDEEFKTMFSNYEGMVRYSSIQNEWKTEMLKLLNNFQII